MNSGLVWRLGLVLLVLSSGKIFAASITGSAAYRERIALPPDATLEATIEDVSRVDAPATVIGRISVMPAGQVPIKFEIPYLESRLQPPHRYNVRVRITQGSQLLWTGTQSYPVLTHGQDTKVGPIQLQRVSDSERTARSLSDTYWRLTALGDLPVKLQIKAPEAHIILQATNNILAGSGGCNQLSGNYHLDGEKLSLGQVASTKRACLKGMEQEADFFKALEQTRTWKIEGSELVLGDEQGRVVARFQAENIKKPHLR